MIPIEIGGKQRYISYTRRGMMTMEKKAGRGYIALMLDPGVTSTNYLLWAGLLGDDKTLTFDQVGDMLEEYLKPIDGEERDRGKEITNAIIDGMREAGYLPRGGATADPNKKGG